MAEPIEMILLRQWASYLSLPVWIMDADGSLVYYNEAAEPVLGRQFEELGPVSVPELADVFPARDERGRPLAAEEMPIAAALLQQRPAHNRISFRAFDGEVRVIEVTAFPVVGQAGTLLGAVAMFWEIAP